MFKKFREFLVDKKDVAKMVLIMSRHGYKAKYGNCGWKYAPDCYYIFVWLNNKDYITVLQEIAETDIELLPPTTGYKEP